MITSKDIRYENGKIQEIEGVYFEESHFYFTKDIFNIDFLCDIPLLEERKRYMEDLWLKFLKEKIDFHLKT